MMLTAMHSNDAVHYNQTIHSIVASIYAAEVHVGLTSVDFALEAMSHATDPIIPKEAKMGEKMTPAQTLAMLRVAQSRLGQIIAQLEMRSP